MFVTLLFLFKTYRKPTVILLMLPLIFIGIVLGLLVLGKSFDFFSILGLLGLIGMNIKNAIVLVEQIDLETAMGKKPLEAVVSGYNQPYCTRSDGFRNNNFGECYRYYLCDVRRYGGYDYGRIVGSFSSDAIRSSGGLLLYPKNQKLNITLI